MASQRFSSRRAVASGVRVEPQVRGYILRIVAGTRTDETVQIGEISVHEFVGERGVGAPALLRRA